MYFELIKTSYLFKSSQYKIILSSLTDDSVVIAQLLDHATYCHSTTVHQHNGIINIPKIHIISNMKY